MNTRTKYILQGIFFLVLGLICIYTYFTGKAVTMKNFSLAGIFLGMFIGILFIKNGLKK